MSNNPFEWRTYESQLKDDAPIIKAGKQNAKIVTATIEKKRKEGKKVWKIDLTPKRSHIYSKA